METYIKPNGRTGYRTHDGKNLTFREYLFLCYYMDGNPVKDAMDKAGYKNKDNYSQGKKLLQKEHISSEVQYISDQIKSKAIADREEILTFFTRVMRGEEKDQFGLDAPIGERTRAAVEIAKRTIDLEDKLKAKEDAKITISLEWGRDEIPQLTGDVVLDADSVRDVSDIKELEE